MQDLTPFTGVWIGMNNNIKYEITFKKGIRKVELNEIKYTIELIFASSVKWFKNEKLIREFNADAPQSILEGYNGSGTLTIDNVENPQKAKLKLAPIYIGKNKGKMDFPTLLELTKTK